MLPSLLLDPPVYAICTSLEKNFPHISFSSHEIYRFISLPPKRNLGHFAFACFGLAKKLQDNPTQLAATVVKTINREEFISIQAQGPYINFKIKSNDYYHKVVLPICNGSFFQQLCAHDNSKIMFEYSQPNTHKILHVGHMRNLCLGNALVRMYRFLGQKALGVTYVGDVGTHVAKCLWYMKYHKQEPPPEKDKGVWLGKIYAKGHTKLENEKGGPLEEKNRRELTMILKQLHDKKGEFFELWKESRQWSVDMMKEAYAWADVDFDHWFFESQMDAPSLTLAKEMLSQGILKKDKGAVGADLENDGLGFCILIKSDGSGLYATKDVFLAKRKFEEFNIKKNIMIVDNRQTLYFKQIFKILEKMGFEQAKHCYHLRYEVVELPDGAMSSRKGNIIPLIKLIKNMENKVKNDYLEKYRETWTNDEINKTAGIVADGAIKYGMLRIDNNRKIIFDMNEWLKLDGETGPYLQYVYARISSLLKKLSFDQSSVPNFSILSSDQDISVLVKLSLFPSVLAKASEEFRPSLMCSYLFELGQLFNTFYSSCPIGNAPSEDLKLSRLHLAFAVGIVMKKGLATLGIETPERM